MATKMTAVTNNSPYLFQLYNWINGGTTKQDEVEILGNGKTTSTLGKDNDYILIPDATPPVQYFSLDNMAFWNLNGDHPNFFVWKTNGGTMYWTLNGPPYPSALGTKIEGGDTIDEVVLTITGSTSFTLSVAAS